MWDVIKHTWYPFKWGLSKQLLKVKTWISNYILKTWWQFMNHNHVSFNLYKCRGSCRIQYIFWCKIEVDKQTRHYFHRHKHANRILLWSVNLDFNISEHGCLLHIIQALHSWHKHIYPKHKIMSNVSRYFVDEYFCDHTLPCIYRRLSERLQKNLLC